MLKKLISVILSFCVILSSAAAFASGVLEGLGIDSISASDESVSRAEFSEAVAKILNGNKTLSPADGVFTDVTSKDSFSGSVYFIYNMGLISGYGNSVFGPDDPLLAEQAVKILVSALGYDILAASKGGYPVGYMDVAKSIDLLDGIVIEGGKNLDGQTASALLENAITCEVLIQTGFGDNASYSTIEGRNLLTEYMHTKKITGILTDNGITSLTGESSVGEGMVIISGQKLKTGDTDAYLMLGGTVDAYVTDDGSGFETIKYITYSDDCNIIRITAKRLLTDDSAFSLTNIVYEDIYGKEKTARLSADADYIYNGKAYPDFVIEDLNFDHGEIVLIDNTGDGTFDVLLIKQARLVILDTVNLAAETIYDKNSAAEIELKDKEYVNIVKDGKISDYTSLSEWDVLNIYQSKNEQYIEIEASSVKKEGTVSEITSIGTVLVDGEYFNVCSDMLLASVKVGQSYTFCIDSMGSIAAITDIGSGDVAYFLESKSETGMNKKLLVRLYTENGKFEIYECAENAKIDGKSIASYGTSYEDGMVKVSAKLNDEASGKLLMYTLNSDEAITSIKLPLAETDYEFDDEQVTDFRIDNTGGTKLRYRREQMSFSGKINIDNSTAVFVLPQDISDEENYNVLSASDLVNNLDYYPVAYSVGKPDGVAEYIVYTNDADLEKEASKIILVDKVTTVADADGEIVQKLVGYSYSGDEVLTSKTDGLFSSLNAGDVIRCATDKTGRVGKYDILYNHDEDTETGTINSDDDDVKTTNFAAVPRILFGNVYYRYGNLLGIVSGTPSGSTLKSEVENQLITSAPIYLIQTSQNDKIVEATVSSINDYVHTGSAYSKVLIYSYNASVRMVIIYK